MEEIFENVKFSCSLIKHDGENWLCVLRENQFCHVGFCPFIYWLGVNENIDFYKNRIKNKRKEI